MEGTNTSDLTRLRRHVPLALLALLSAVAMAVLLAPRAEAATLTVNNTNDAGPGSLRQAIADANVNADSDVIDVTATGTINLQGALPNLATAMQINGPGADRLTVRRDAGGDYRIFTVPGNQENCCGNQGGPSVTIKGLTITNGRAPNGGGIKNGAYPDALTRSDLTLDGVAVVGNQSTNTLGGGIYSAISKITINNSLIANNSGPEGTNGGGINITSATGATITNTTISGNQAPGGFGGGLYTGDRVTLVNSTVAGNRAYFGANFYASTSLAQTMKNTLIADPIEGTNCRVFSGSSTPPPMEYTASNNNLEYPGDSCSFVTRGVGRSADPLLLPLTDNGGPTKTRAIAGASPAIDTSGSGATAKDQRGAAAFDGDANGSVVRDVGAYEHVSDAALRPTLNLPASIFRNPEGPNGANVTYEATASDYFGREISPVCTPTSGSLFPIGTTSVTCTATDSAGRTATGTFTVNVSQLGTNLTAQSSASTVAYGKKVTISGTLKDEFGTNLTSRPVTLFAAPAGTSDFVRVLNLVTSADGGFAADVSPKANTVYGVSFAGDDDHRSAGSPEIPVQVRMQLSLDLSKPSVNAGQRVSISGRATPAHNGTVELAIKRNGKTVATRELALSTTSPYRTTFRPRGAGTYTINATIAGDADHAGDTISRKLKVSRR